MAKKNVDYRKVFQPSDTIAFMAIGVGLVIALVAPYDNLAVRLIGICIAILGGVALFMMVSPRLTDLQIINPIRPSSMPDIMSRTVQDAKKRTQTFDSDAYRRTFGQAETEEQTFFDESQTSLFEENLARPQTPPTETSVAAGMELIAEGDSSVRIVGTRKSTTSGSSVPTLVSEARQAARQAQIDELTQRRQATTFLPSQTDPFEGSPDQEIQLSDDVIIRPARKRDAEPPTEESTASSMSNVIEPDIALPATEDVELGDAFEQVDDQEPSQGADVDAVVHASADDAAMEQPQEILDAEAIAAAEAEAWQARQEASDLESEELEPEPAVAAPPRETSRRSPSVSLSTFVSELNEEDLTSQEPRREFDYLLNRVLMVIRSATNARTAAFLWVNSERQQLVVEAKITEAEDEFTTKRKIPMRMDALSQIARDGRPEIITQISASAETELLPYYDRPAGTVSFIGVPVYYGGNVVGILCADSKLEDAYSDITVGFFGQFTKLISGLVSAYTTKYDLLQASSTLEAIEELRQAIGASPLSAASVIRAMFSSVIQRMDVSRIGVVSYDSARREWTLTDARTAMDEDYRSYVGASVNVTSSAVGTCITSALSVVQTQEFTTTRVFDAEPALDFGQFVAVPLRTAKECFGALFLENLEGSLSTQDIALAEAMAEYASTFYEQLHQIDSLRGTALLDHETGVLNEQGFEMRVREEFARAVDYNIPLTVCMVHLDASRASQEQRMHALLHVLRLVKEQLREYDVVARFGQEHIALGLIGYKLQEAQNWTETMRREIASSPVNVDGKRLSFTVSIGIAQAEPRDTWDDLIAHANAALEVSMRSGNKVTVFA
ncbi:MAG: diguanylate cyclase [Candidatus Kapabacteria bacterium]|nr:diguanylate cyclase [Candidatus Kapabacteria bacterium]